jgi:hypothetical protein
MELLILWDNKTKGKQMNNEIYKYEELIKDFDKYHSEFQQDNFIIGSSSGTIYGKYKQSLRELESRVNTLKNSIFDFENKKLDLEKLNLDVENNKLSLKSMKSELEENNFGSDLDKSLFVNSIKALEIDLKRLDMLKNRLIISLWDMENNILEIKKELIRFYEHAITYKKELGELSEDKKRQLEKEFWVDKAMNMASIDLIMTNSLQKPTYEMILSFPREERVGILNALRDKEKNAIGNNIHKIENKEDVKIEKSDILDVYLDSKEILQLSQGEN